MGIDSSKCDCSCTRQDPGDSGLEFHDVRNLADAYSSSYAPRPDCVVLPHRSEPCVRIDEDEYDALSPSMKAEAERHVPHVIRALKKEQVTPSRRPTPRLSRNLTTNMDVSFEGSDSDFGIDSISVQALNSEPRRRVMEWSVATPRLP